MCDAKMERVRLTLKQKKEIIEHKSANPHISRAQLQAWAMKTFNLASAPSKSALTDILHGRAVQHDGHFDDSRKSMRLAKCPELEAKLIAWINACESISLPIVTQSVLREKAKQLADEDHDQTMAFSNGWIEKFQQRHGLKSRRVYGEAGSVDPATIEEGKHLLQKGDGSSEYFDANRQINLTVFTPRDFEEFLLERRKHVTVSTLNGYSSAIKDLHRRNHIPLLAAYEKDFATFFSGLKRMQASKYQKGCPKESGKDPLPYSLYEELCRVTIQRHDGGFTHFFLTKQWNLMCRSASVQTLCIEHLSAHDDSIGCVMYKSKTNQDGSGPIDPRHMYTNPLNPSNAGSRLWL
ncbi:hypothetical protein Ae201684P_020346 [Aphanomyces euteiches]|uniref:HTH CENPB-type domain-containing protein n=1 Tax=Aphanomyces euteiches TaxID=100861 RepID=A0A6G0WC40_9STRA|nr:hypothetical protein Ae201684_016582 [Aphanomyces euteiches]KAH9084088.1 hypothetical protein Ae201684P_020346 [Aphanomyces euteiches]